MKLLRPGRDQKGWSKEFTCTGEGNGDGGCGAQLLVEQDDLFQIVSSDYGGDTNVDTLFCCMECGVFTDVKVPSSLEVRRSTMAMERKRWKEQKR